MHESAGPPQQRDPGCPAWLGPGETAEPDIRRVHGRQLLPAQDGLPGPGPERAAPAFLAPQDKPWARGPRSVGAWGRQLSPVPGTLGAAAPQSPHAETGGGAVARTPAPGPPPSGRAPCASRTLVGSRGDQGLGSQGEARLARAPSGAAFGPRPPAAATTSAWAEGLLGGSCRALGAHVGGARPRGSGSLPLP